jgi:hypothetical protein
LPKLIYVNSLPLTPLATAVPRQRQLSLPLRNAHAGIADDVGASNGKAIATAVADGTVSLSDRRYTSPTT